MKKVIVEFTYTNGEKEEVEFVTDRLKWSIAQWMRNRPIADHTIISENKSNSKGMLLG